MASSLLLKRLVSSNLVPSSLLRQSCAVAQPASSRLFNTNAIREYDSEEPDIDADRRPDLRVFPPFAGVLGPFPTRRRWGETIDGLYLRISMAGWSQKSVEKDVEFSMKRNNILLVNCCEIPLPKRFYKPNGIKSEKKNGQLEVFVPKIKEEERTDDDVVQHENESHEVHHLSINL